jgi:glycolate oxidase iron-sulfur subunit
VALLLGCAQQVLEPDINLAVVDVLTRNGVEVVVPREQRCCGALAWHQGDLRAAQTFARLNLRAFPTDVDAILASAAGCGSALREYHLVLRGTLNEGEGERFARRVLDVSAFLTQLGLRELPGGFDRPTRVVYQDACHLLNAQNVRDEPRNLLRTIPNLSLCELDEPHLCCGSAGTYNLDQPEIAASLGQKKAEAIIATGAEIAVTGNIGCLIQLRGHLARLGAATPIRHTFQLLRDAYNRGQPQPVKNPYSAL